MSKKRGPKFKSRRPFQRDVVFKKKAKLELFLVGSKIVNAFPDRNERDAYIAALIKGLETEPNMEIKK